MLGGGEGGVSYYPTLVPLVPPTFKSASTRSTEGSLGTGADTILSHLSRITSLRCSFDACREKGKEKEK